MATTVLGICFDGLAISGIVSEFLNLAEVFRLRGSRILFDPGYDITIRRPGVSERSVLPVWLDVIRSLGDNLPRGYSADLIREAYERVAGGTSVEAAGIYVDVCRELAARLTATFEREGIRFLDVENGTLPDNPLFTEALYLAIAEYGANQKLGKFVLWRDFDLMWSAEPHRYGPYPYPGVRKPATSPHIEYAVVTDWMRRRMEAWAHGPRYHVIPDRFFTPETVRRNDRSFRATYRIPEDAFLVARCTRVIPQKSIERDLRVVSLIQQRLISSGNPRKVFLAVAGMIDEDRDEYERLRALESALPIAGQVVWANGLLPFKADRWPESSRFSVRDLLAESDLSSFLTTFDYEGFGNPPGEAMATGVPFMATTYELYEEVYGSRGAVAPLLAIGRNSTPSDPIDDDFISWVLRVLTDRNYRGEIVTRNLEVCRRHFSLDALGRQMNEIFGSSLS